VSTLLDTNVLSELLRANADPAVVAWVGAQPGESLFVASVTEAEMRLGVRLIPAGRRRQALEAAVAAMFAEDFAGRIQPFDSAAVPGYVDIAWKRRAAGRPIAQFDAQIAAIALCHGHRLATRNVSDFEGCGLPLVNPWKSAV
jgi:predicted nucleic acid-binding protein